MPIPKAAADRMTSRREMRPCDMRSMNFKRFIPIAPYLIESLFVLDLIETVKFDVQLCTAVNALSAIWRLHTTE